MPCTYFDTYDEPGALCDPWEEKVVVARKSHNCCECGKSILAKERYARAWGICIAGDADRGPVTFKRCIECHVLADRLQTQFELCIPWGSLLMAKEELENGQVNWQ